jgi:quinohemoprotein ethanol dehydrogenase
MKNRLLSTALISAAFALLSHSITAAENVDWPLHGLTNQEQRFSSLTQINNQNVDQLGLAWSFDTDFNRGLEATPIVVDGVMYATGNWSFVYALDARTGELRWKYDPKVPKRWGGKGCCDVVNRGVAVEDGKVIVGTFDARLIALDANSGEVIWETQTADITKYPYTITGAPRIAKGKVFIGNGGAEFGVRGFIAAYDLDTGEQVWKFYTVPGNPADGFETPALEKAAQTWTGQWWKLGGGGTVWDSIVYDEELDQLYFGVGNGSPWDRLQRSPQGGDNLYLNSIVAVNPDTGEYIWHYQETPADNWDFTATQQIMLADMPWQGEARKVIWHAPKNGFFFVIDRITGTPISIEPYTATNWATHYDKTTWRPVETDDANYQKTGGSVLIPSSLGAHNWHPMAHSPTTGLVYIPVRRVRSAYIAKDLDLTRGYWNLGVELPRPPLRGMPTLLEKAAFKLLSGYLLAWNPQTQSEAWRVEYGAGGTGGILATAGNLLMVGASTGELHAVTADTGKALWQYSTQVGVMAAPVSYMIDNEQYIAVAAGWGGAYGLAIRVDGNDPVPPSRILVFKLGANGQLPPLPTPTTLQPVPARVDASEELIEHGYGLYSNNCSPCHGGGAISAKSIPDLRNLPMAFYDNFDNIVRGGMMENAGMPKFDNVLSEQDVKAIYAYIIDEANTLREEREPSIFNPIINWGYDILATIVAWIETP